MRTYQFRLYPNKSQQEKLWIHANKLNFVYNTLLDKKINAYKTDKTSLSRFDLQKELIILKQNDPILQQIHSQVLQQVTYRLDISYKNFFRKVKSKQKEAGFPKFRSCKNFFGICYPQSGYSFTDKSLLTKVYGNIPFVKHREILGKIKQIQITTKNNKWFLNITTDYSPEKTNIESSVGIDVGLKTLVVTNFGEKIQNCSHAKYFDKQISKIQSRADKLKKGSRKRKHLNKVRQKLYDAKNRKINDFQHKVSRRLVRSYDAVFAEDLSSKSMSESNYTNLNRAIRNAKLAQLLFFLGYKANKLVLVNPKNTSRTCNCCGYIKQDLKLSDREITCENCGVTYDRDENAAKNVYCLGQAIVFGRCTEDSLIQEALGFNQE